MYGVWVHVCVYVSVCVGGGGDYVCTLYMASVDSSMWTLSMGS